MESDTLRLTCLRSDVTSRFPQRDRSLTQKHRGELQARYRRDIERTQRPGALARMQTQRTFLVVTAAGGVTLIARRQEMAANAIGRSVLDTFRGVWVRGHLDYLRAVEALEAAIDSAKQAPGTDLALDEHEVQRSDQNVESARSRLAEIQTTLESQFDRFCGLST